MKSFLKKIIIFIFAFLITAIVIVFLTEKIAHNKLCKRGRGVVIDKNNRLDSLQGNKIILVGGSNVCYGINSKIIEDSLKMPVVDMAINADMGMYFYYEQIKHAIKKGDIIVAIPEYAAYDGKLTYGDDGLYSIALLDKRNFSKISLYQWLRFPLFMGDVINTNVRTGMKGGKNKFTWGRFQYDIYGDYFGHKNDTSISSKFSTEKKYYMSTFDTSEYPNKQFIKLINSFAFYCKSKGVMYIHLYPVYSKNMYNKEVVSKISRELLPIKFTGEPENYLYSFDSLYDSPNHLLYNIRDERTFKVIRDIKGALDNTNR